MTRYNAFLLRVWRVDDGGKGQWSLRLQSLDDGAIVRFATLESLHAHLRDTLDPGSVTQTGTHKPIMPHT